jgi:DNA-binding transcriptional regulator YiaG
MADEKALEILLVALLQARAVAKIVFRSVLFGSCLTLSLILENGGIAMPDIAKFLKDEIRRLARKEIRVQTKTTQKAAIQHRREITQLKRLIDAQEKKIAALQGMKHSLPDAAPVSGTKIPEGIRYSARSVRAQRHRLKLSAQEFAKLLGVSMQTVYSWEQGRARPRRSQIATLVAARTIGRREAWRRLGIVG